MARILRRSSLFRTTFVCLVAWSLLGACADATEIRLNVYTDVPCTDSASWKGIAVYVGAPDSNLENKAPALTSTSCDRNGQIGSLVITPSGPKDAEVGLRVVAGIGQNPEDCATHQYKGCIVARRSVRFNRHATLELDITLTGNCSGIGCDAAHTCVDGTCAETSTIVDLVSVPEASTGPTVRCGDNGTVCPTSGNVCCLTVDANAGTSTGECKPAAQCPSTSAVLYCDDESDCTSFTDDQGRIGMCELSYTPQDGTLFVPTAVAGSQCVFHAGTQGIRAYGLELCQTRLPCLGGTLTCEASNGMPQNPLPGYFWCLYKLD
ncbi:MAG: hypothetical protein ABUL62_13780 [Myxococcales bacterium]